MSKSADFTYIHSATFLPNLKPQFDLINVLEPIKDDRYMKNGCLYLQTNFNAAVFDDRSGLLCVLGYSILRCEILCSLLVKECECVLEVLFQILIFYVNCSPTSSWNRDPS